MALGETLVEYLIAMNGRFLRLRRGSIAYDESVGRIVAVGIDLRNVFDPEYAKELYARHRDEEGLANVARLIADDAEDTGFTQERIRAALSAPAATEDWRIGETIAADILEGDMRCTLPWPAVRDLRNLAGSPPGTDHVGIVEDDRGALFAFAEVKTSIDNKNRPPGVLHGRSGMVDQLLDLRDASIDAQTLVVYLGHRAEGAPWLEKYRRATRRWLLNPNDFVLIGLMVRPLAQDPTDLRARANTLHVDRPDVDMRLYALYVPGDVFTRLRNGWAA